MPNLVVGRRVLVQHYACNFPEELSPPLQPRPPTTGAEEVPLQPRYLPGFEKQASQRETRSEPRELQHSFDFQPPKTVDTELGLASVPAMAIGSSAEVLASIVENQVGLRRNSCLVVNSSSCFHPGLSMLMSRSDTDVVKAGVEEDVKSPEDCEFVRSPSTEMTNPSEATTPGAQKDVCDISLEGDLSL